MSTTPTLRDAAQALVDASEGGKLSMSHVVSLRAALTQGAGEAVEPDSREVISTRGDEPCSA